MTASQGDDPDVAKVRANPLRALLHRVGMYSRGTSSGKQSAPFTQLQHCRVVEFAEACNNCTCVPLGIRRRKHEHEGLGVCQI